MYDAYHEMIANKISEDDLFLGFTDYNEKLMKCTDFCLLSPISKSQQILIVNTNCVERFIGYLRS